MEGQRARVRVRRQAGRRRRARTLASARASSRRRRAQTRFTGYETEQQRTTVAALAHENGHYLVKLAESPFYAPAAARSPTSA